jgi:hypothetical protein
VLRAFMLPPIRLRASGLMSHGFSCSSSARNCTRWSMIVVLHHSNRSHFANCFRNYAHHSFK